MMRAGGASGGECLEKKGRGRVGWGGLGTVSRERERERVSREGREEQPIMGRTAASRQAAGHSQP